MSAAAGFSARSSAVSTARTLPILRDVRYFNEHQASVATFDATKLGFSVPPKESGGKVSFYRDGMDNIVVPFTYDGKMAMNYGWIVRHGKFDFVKTKGKEAKADSYQLQANFPVRSVEEALDGAGDVRKEGMLEFMRVLDVIDRKAREWILADTDGSLFGVPFTAADLDPKVRLDGKIEKGKFNSTLKAGAMPNGDPMLLKAYLKVPSDPTEFKVYADLHLNGSRLDSTVANFLEHVKWNNDVGILFSVKDMIKSSQGISVRIRVDAVGVMEAPKTYIAIANPFETAAGTPMEDE
jgi:hypothetical protein